MHEIDVIFLVKIDHFQFWFLSQSIYFFYFKFQFQYEILLFWIMKYKYSRKGFESMPQTTVNPRYMNT